MHVWLAFKKDIAVRLNRFRAKKPTRGSHEMAWKPKPKCQTGNIFTFFTLGLVDLSKQTIKLVGPSFDHLPFLFIFYLLYEYVCGMCNLPFRFKMQDPSPSLQPFFFTTVLARKFRWALVNWCKTFEIYSIAKLRNIKMQIPCLVFRSTRYIFGAVFRGAQRLILSLPECTHEFE